ncbi:hypothetical protein [Methylobacterium gregans]|uniref:Uncharacterized protein n=1 Tax=Methylobacterium gregans TaxID=374424 RepID=A0AA37MCP0_9HYPH|nr:hypothetical protein [Methylobacterium gregans]MDQ0522927.1 hypothetical protein [Methylobacterium gregans]GJD81510.1 hypothetical protein NBEOAGPD_4761 [Methylobacterium gregans]GLS55822.1 hypothetical protein GCM10007886_40070 [Methylobacterium gregans]
MGTGKRYGTDPAADAAEIPGVTLQRIAAALGVPIAVFIEGVAVEPRLHETLELLRLWSLVREPELAQRVLAFLAAVIAEQS